MATQHHWDKIGNIIQQYQTFVLTTHINPDGDALGSEIAMAEYLRQLGKTVFIVNNTPTQTNYQFLDPDGHILIFSPNDHKPLIAQADCFIIVDISDWDRLKELGQQIQESKAPTICIDHHHVTKPFAQVDIIDESASSTGELIYDFLLHQKCNITPVIARALYTCILTDTGSFRFSNTTPRTHAIVADLLDRGVDARTVYAEVYERNSPGKVALMGSAINDFHYECDGRLVWFRLTQDMFRQARAHQWDTEGFPELPRTIDGVEVSLMFTELKDANVKISLRSTGTIIIGDIARQFGGGGHNFAAGALIRKPLSEAVPQVLNEVINVVNQYTKGNKSKKLVSE